jgi:tricarballylate dehydrogenase
MSRQSVEVVVVGAGVAGLSAAVSAAEALAGSGKRVLLLDKAAQAEAGGNTRWTDAYFRLEDVYEPADGFADDMARFSQGKTDKAYVDVLLQELPYAMDWVQGHGVRFHRRATYFVTASRPRMMPVGGGEAMVRALTRACQELQVDVRYEADVQDVVTTDEGWELTLGNGGGTVSARTCVVACGGFEGDPERLARHLGEPARSMKPIAPGGALNTGEVLDALIAQGAAPSGEWSNFHGEPVDVRSTQAEASVMVFPYGVLVDRSARRFLDEGLGTVDETYEDVSRAILDRPGNWAGLIADAAFLEVPGIERGLLTDRAPFRADTLAELAEMMGLDAAALEETIAEFNAAPREGVYDPRACDGLHTVGLTPAKSNWARPIDTPPFLGIPLTTDIVFTYGGVATDEQARVVDVDGRPLDGLYAAGECTGIYYHKYPGATSVLRGLVFGRLAGRKAAEYVGATHA